MKKCLLVLMALAILFQVSTAWASDEVPLSTAAAEVFEQYRENPMELLQGDPSVMGFLVFLSGIGVYSVDPGFEVMMNAEAYFGVSEVDSDKGLFFVYPLFCPDTEQKYRLAFYDYTDGKLKYESGLDMNYDFAMAMLTGMCKENYAAVGLDSLAGSLRLLDDFTAKAWPGQEDAVTAFLKGIRPLPAD